MVIKAESQDFTDNEESQANFKCIHFVCFSRVKANFDEISEKTSL
jgi:hypothetical protein